jgi:hypothetical protein
MRLYKVFFLIQSGITVARIVQVLCLRRPEGPYRHYLATALSNLSQVSILVIYVSAETFLKFISPNQNV